MSTGFPGATSSPDPLAPIWDINHPQNPPVGLAGAELGYNAALWEHHHHHHHGAAPYHPELLAGFPCSPDLWPVGAGTPLHAPTAPNHRTQCMIQQRFGQRTSSTSSSGNSGSAVGHKKPRRRVATLAQRRAANIRERRRMFNLNEAFDKLRRKVPTFAYEKRLSRIETLRLAITYISFMSELLNGTSKGTDSGSPIFPVQGQRGEYIPYSLIN
ncbi:hypothetical protein LSTR_LSTR004943 [Laodelphax striatellus]|uniref:BHLH domain-containing protein n=1 Tax=Laodelphax striatellus TaxID=195883 RepID=A0A482XNR1_LAOST|nr:hypothetical protein LSTR_LSTR004943 [Laodelphax striatellus]